MTGPTEWVSVKCIHLSNTINQIGDLSIKGVMKIKKPIIMFDKTEVVMLATIVGDMKKKSHRLLNLTYDKFTKIAFVQCKERKLFKTVDSEKIVLTVKGYAKPIEYSKKENSAHYQEYKKGFEKFASDNTITFVDETN